MNDNTFWLIDGSSFLFRSFYALPPLSNDQGQPTGAILGVCNMLKNLLELHDPNHIVVVFDPPGNTTRHKLYPDYKGNRRETPEELKVQIEPLFAIIQAMGLPLVQVPGEEADDVIGTLAKQASDKAFDVIICTSDKDFAQLVGPNITLLNTMTQKAMDTDGVIEKFGLRPDQIIDFLALCGDSVDNIPGVPKVGAKTAVKWLNEYQTAENLIANADQIKGKIGESLRASLKDIPLYQALTTINTKLDLPCTWQSIQRKEAQTTQLLSLIKPLGFKRWALTLEKQAPTPMTNQSAVGFDTTIITSQTAWDDLLDALTKAPIIVFDLETTSLDTHTTEPIGIAFAMEDTLAYYVPLIDQPWDAQTIFSQLKGVFNNPKQRLIGHNLKFDLRVLLAQHHTVTTPIIDTLLMSYVAQSQRRGHDLDALAEACLGMQTVHYEDLLAKWDANDLRTVPLKDVAHYAGEDVIVTWRLWTYFKQTQTEFSAYLPLLEKLEWPLVPILAKMEHHGVLIDADKLEKQSQTLAKVLDECTQEALDIVGHDFNLASTKQLREILYDRLQLPIVKKTPKGEPSTSEEALEKLREHHPLPKIILQHRHTSKLKNTYTDRLPEQVHAQTGRIHCSYNQAITSTGRLSSNHPNLQNIPIKTPAGRDIRRAFITRPAHCLLCADYSQIELRIMAHWSKEPALLEAFGNDLDVHATTASELFAKPLSSINSEQRRFAKTINFGLIYGMSPWGLGKQLNIDRSDAEHYIDHYFKRYPQVLAYMESTKALAKEKGYVETLLGRRIYLPDIQSKQRQRQMAAERAAINGPMQGSAADIIKQAMLACNLALSQQPATMIMQVHDELIFEVALDAVDEVENIINQAMIQVASLTVPLKVNIGRGKNWDAAH